MTKRSPALEAAIQAAGSVAALAQKLKVTRQAVDQWDKVPAERIGEVSAATGIPPDRLRPDLFGKSRAA